MLEILYSVWISLFPFVLLYGAFEGPKVVWLWTGGFFLTVYWTFRLFLMHPLHVSKTGLWFLGWLFILGVASVIGIHPVDSLIGGSYRHQGVLFFFTLFLIGETLQYLKVKYRNILNILLGFAVVIESIIIVEQKVFFWSGRPYGTIGEPNAAAGFLAVGLWWILRWHGVPKWVRGIAYFLVLAAVTATQSRTGILVAALITVGWCILQLKRLRHTAVLFAVSISAILATMIFAYVQLRVINIVRAPSQFENRLLYWSVGVGEFIKRPILGYGAESDEMIYDTAFQVKSVPLVDLIIDRSHNLFLDVALWSGITGLAVFIGWLLSLARGAAISHNYLKLITFAGWLVFAFVQPLGVVHWVQLILLLM